MYTDADLDIARRVSFDVAKQAIALTEERTGIVRAANPAFLSLIGPSQGDVVGRNVVDLGLWSDAGQRNSFLSCLAIEGRLVRYPLLPSSRFPNVMMYVSVDPVVVDEERLHLVRLDVVRTSLSEDQDNNDPVDGLQFLSRTATDFLVDDSVGLQTRIVRELRTLVPHSIVVFSSLDPEMNELRLRAFSAPAALDPIIAKSSGRYMDKVVARLDEAGRARLLHEGLHRVVSYPISGCTDSDELSVHRSTTFAAAPYAAFAAELGVDSMSNIALAWDGEAFGVLSILLRRPDEVPNRVLVETFVRQASVAMQRNRRAHSLNSALSEKETLLREIHHRVKNNLQIVASLLNLQTERTHDSSAVQALAEAAERVQSMALVHTMLYGSDTLASINAAEYFRTLASQIVRGAAAECHGVELRFQLEPLILDADRAIPAGLIVNELVTNALKYGVGIPGPGTITIGLARTPLGAEISVSDTGRRLSPDFRPQDVTSLGMQLVSSLARQLNGRLESSVGEETCFRIHFPL